MNALIQAIEELIIKNKTRVTNAEKLDDGRLIFAAECFLDECEKLKQLAIAEMEK